MATYTEPKHVGDVLLVEVAKGWTKQKGVLSATTVDLEIGTVLTKVAGKYKPVDLAATNGSQLPVGILAVRAPINTGEQPIVFIARGASVAKDQLVWPVGATTNQIAAALDALELKGIVAVTTL